MEKIVKRGTAEATLVREGAYMDIERTSFSGLEWVGRTAEGIVYQDAEGKAIVIKVIVKALDFDAEFEVTDYEAQQTVKAQERVEKKAKADAKKAEAVAKAEAKAKAKAEKDAEDAIVPEEDIAF